MKRSLIISCSIALLAATTNFAQNTYTSNSDLYTSQDVTSIGENTPSYAQNGITGASSGSTEKNEVLDLEHQITVYPNPAVGKIRVVIPSTLKVIGVQVYGADGQLLDLPIPIEDPNGQFIDFDMTGERYHNSRVLVLRTNKGVITKRLVQTRN